MNLAFVDQEKNISIAAGFYKTKNKETNKIKIKQVIIINFLFDLII